jgi:hypothetical protein
MSLPNLGLKYERQGVLLELSWSGIIFDTYHLYRSIFPRRSFEAATWLSIT